MGAGMIDTQEQLNPCPGSAGSDYEVGAGFILQKPYTVSQLAEALGCSYSRARRLALDEGGTLRIPSKSEKRSMTRIPRSVFERILRKYRIPTKPPAVLSSRP